MGFGSRLDHYPASGYTVIDLSNRDRNADSMADLVAELLTGRTLPGKDLPILEAVRRKSLRIFEEPTKN